MTHYLTATVRRAEMILLALQAFQVLFLWIHDWVPLGCLNDVAAVRSVDTRSRLVVVTLIQSVPFTLGLLFCLRSFGHAFPHWLYMWLWISYSALFVGQARARWIPYLPLILRTRCISGDTLVHLSPALNFLCCFFERFWCVLFFDLLGSLSYNSAAIRRACRESYAAGIRSALSGKDYRVA